MHKRNQRWIDTIEEQNTYNEQHSEPLKFVNGKCVNGPTPYDVQLMLERDAIEERVFDGQYIDPDYDID